MEQLDLSAQAPAVDPWAAARAVAAPGAIVFRHVDLIRGRECFFEIPRTEKTLAAGIDIYDGATVTFRSPQTAVAETNIVLANDHTGALV